jgi:hypothetical protein
MSRASLRAEALRGTLAGYEGHFTLALEKAREKMKNFQLPDARYYILQLMQAVLASGARAIAIERDVTVALGSYRITIRFDGPGYTRDELERLYDHLFASQAERSQDRLRELALGIASCQSLKPRLILVGCWSEAGSIGWQRVAATRGTPTETVGEVPPSTHPLPHRIEIQGQGLDFSHAASAVDLVESHCTLVPIPIRINDVGINAEGGTWAGACPWPGYRFRQGEMSGMLGLPYETAAQSMLQLLRYGVLFARRGDERLHPPVSVICENPALRKNASQMDVVEDGNYLAFIESMQQILMDFALGFARQRIPRYQEETVHEFLIRHFDEWLSPALVLGEEGDCGDLAPVLALPMFRDVRGQMRSLREIASQYRKDGFLSVTAVRMPYAPVRDWLVLTPTPYEEPLLLRLFGQVRKVDGEIYRVARSTAFASQFENTRRHLVLESLLASPRLAEYSTVLPGTAGVTLAIPDDHPSGRSFLVARARRTEGAASVIPLPLGGLHLLVDLLDGPSTAEEAVRLAHFAISDHAPSLYQRLLVSLRERVSGATRTAQEERSLAHLVTWWQSRLDPGLAGVDPIRAALGAEAWTSRLFRTRAGLPVSLADIETWLAHFDTLAVASGGRRVGGDHALDVGPAAVRLLGRIFGEERFQRATLKAALLGVRQKQLTLSRAAENPDALVLPEAADEEQELLDLLEEAAASLEALPGREDHASGGDGQASVDPVAPPAPAERREPAVGNDDPGPASDPLAREGAPPGGAESSVLAEPRGAEARVKLASRQAQASPPAVGPEVPDEAALPPSPWLAQHAFTQGSICGLLAVGPDETASIALCSERRVVARLRPFGLGVGGWIHGEGRGDELADERLRGPLRLLHDALAAALRRLVPGSADFEAGRRRLLAYVEAADEEVRLRLAGTDPADPLATVPLIPTSGGTLASLRAVAREAGMRGETLVIREGEDDPFLDFPVVVVGGVIDERFLEHLLRLPVRPARPRPDHAAHDQVLAAVRRELRILRDHGDFRLTDEMLEKIRWERRLRGFIRHDPESGVTGIDPDHAVLRRVLRSFRSDPTLVAVLVSSVYTAINRGLEEIRDGHEMAFLEALLGGARASSPPPA